MNAHAHVCPRLGKRAGGWHPSLPRGRCRREIKAMPIRAARHGGGCYILWWQRQLTPYLALWVVCELNGRNFQQNLPTPAKEHNWRPVGTLKIREPVPLLNCSLVRFRDRSVAFPPLLDGTVQEAGRLPIGNWPAVAQMTKKSVWEIVGRPVRIANCTALPPPLPSAS